MGYAAPNALGETGALRERWLRRVFERAVSETSSITGGDPLPTGFVVESGGGDSSGELLTSPSSLILDQDAAMALLKEINADLATGRIRQKMAVSLFFFSFFYTCWKERP